MTFCHDMPSAPCTAAMQGRGAAYQLMEYTSITEATASCTSPSQAVSTANSQSIRR